jgi:hypothetical protein
MAFPALIPSGRAYVSPEYPSTAHKALRGNETRVRHANQPVDGVLELSFRNVPPVAMESIVAHYGETRGPFYSFLLPPEVFSGADDVDTFTITGHRWIYDQKPAIEDIPIAGGAPSNRHNIIVRLRSVPPEPIVALGGRARITLTAVGGIAYDADGYWASWAEQNHVWYAESYTSWWAT